MHRSPFEKVCDAVIDFQDRMPRQLSRFGSVAFLLGAIALVALSLRS